MLAELSGDAEIEAVAGRCASAPDDVISAGSSSVMPSRARRFEFGAVEQESVSAYQQGALRTPLIDSRRDEPLQAVVRPRFGPGDWDCSSKGT